MLGKLFMFIFELGKLFIVTCIVTVIGTIVFFVLCQLGVCIDSPEEEGAQIAEINKSIAPDGHLTKTHLYVHWPAVYSKPEPRRKDRGGKEIVPALTLKMPVEYLPWDFAGYDLNRSLFAFDCGEMARYENGCRTGADKGAVDYSTRIRSALSIEKDKIIRVHFSLMAGAKPLVSMRPDDHSPPDQARTRLKAYLLEQYRNSYPVTIQRDSYFVTPLSDREPGVSPDDKPPEFKCDQDAGCTLTFGLRGRRVHIWGIGEALDSIGDKNMHQRHFFLPEPKPNVLPKWHEKLDPTRALLNSFVVPEDSPEIKGMFFHK